LPVWENSSNEAIAGGATFCDSAGSTIAPSKKNSALLIFALVWQGPVRADFGAGGALLKRP